MKANKLKVGDYVLCSPKNMLTEAGRTPHFDGEIVSVHEASCTVKCLPMGSKKYLFLEIWIDDIMKPHED